MKVAILPHHEDTIIAVAVGGCVLIHAFDPDDSTETEKCILIHLQDMQ